LSRYCRNAGGLTTATPVVGAGAKVVKSLNYGIIWTVCVSIITVT
jgi:hypothetical protein